MKKSFLSIAILSTIFTTAITAEYLMKSNTGVTSNDFSSEESSIPEGVISGHYNYVNSIINKPNWTLCYDSDVDGMGATQFHSGCDNKGSTITIIKVTHNSQDYYIGGYNKDDWGNNASWVHQSITEARLFKLKEGDYQNTINNSQLAYSTFHHPSYGPSFGAGFDVTVFSGGISPNYCNPVGFSNWGNDWCGGAGGGGSFQITGLFSVKVFAVSE